jgi:SAM-dependent methyltransferase
MHPIAVKFGASFRTFADALLVPIQAGQGVHIDPALLPPPDDQSWPQEHRSAWRGQDMEVFRSCLRLNGKDVRASILDDLSAFYNMPPEECAQRCLHWEEWSVQEWKAGDRSSPGGLRDFYNSVQSWSFDLMWYAYLQATGHAFPAAVMAARFSLANAPGNQHLDFGSGVGVTSQLFARRGYSTTLADVSRPLLDFARWRLERHGDRAQFLDLNTDTLPSTAYDCITALDTLVHVPDFEVTARDLHRALKPGGLLFANFDIRDRNAETSAWHLYDSPIDLDCRLQACGFVKVKKLGISPTCYKRVEPNTARHRLRRARNTVAAPGRSVLMWARRVRWPTPRRALKLVYRLATGRKLVTNKAFIRP